MENKRQTEIIDVYTREDAIEDGEIVTMESLTTKDLHDDVLAKIKYPISFTKSVALQIEDKPKHESNNGRCWDVVTMLHYAIQSSNDKNAHTIFFEMVLNDSKTDPDANLKEVKLKALVHGDDYGDPVITVMQTHEE